MSRQSGVHVNRPAQTIAGLRSGPLEQPLVQEALDVLIGRRRMGPAQVLAHQLESGFEKIERHPERGGLRRSRHATNVRVCSTRGKRSAT
jgi:hypothetical protein